MHTYPHLDQLEPDRLVQRARLLAGELSRLRSTAIVLTTTDLDWMWRMKFESMYALLRADMLMASRTSKQKSQAAPKTSGHEADLD